MLSKACSFDFYPHTLLWRILKVDNINALERGGREVWSRNFYAHKSVWRLTEAVSKHSFLNWISMMKMQIIVQNYYVCVCVIIISVFTYFTEWQESFEDSTIYDPCIGRPKQAHITSNGKWKMEIATITIAIFTSRTV